MRLLIVIPAYNEQENIERVVDNLVEHYPQYDYLVVNDGSRDHTGKICRERGYRFLDLPVNLGLTGAFQAGLRYADRLDYDMAIQFDGDGQHDPGYIGAMAEKMAVEDLDVVIGSRFKNEKKPFGLRMLGNQMIQLAIKITTGATIKDPTSGMRLFNRTMIQEFARNLNYGPEPDTIAYLIRGGASVQEVQVQMRERIAGESYFNFRRATEYMIRMCTSIILIQWFRKRGD
ncbi:MAG: glycosyltransferase family 2 protein [Oscillospiraceae bacterium]|nr:glycosyltransferase family 2 protein [Oscillospiraceae bacterium]